MSKLYDGYDAITASEEFKQRMVRTLQSEPQTKSVGLHLKRRTAILIGAAAVLVAMGTAVAVGITTVGKAKQQTQERLERTEDERYAEARREAEHIVNTTMYETPIEGEAQVGDLRLRLISALNDPNDLELDFTLTGETTGVVLTLDAEAFENDAAARNMLEQHETFCAVGVDARDFRLTSQDQDYAPYYKDDAPYGAGYGVDNRFAMLFKTLPEVLKNGDVLTLSGTLYRYDKEGSRIGEIGAFSIPFTFAETEELREMRIQKEMQKILEISRENDTYRHDLVADLPDEATPIEATLGDVTVADVTADEEGLLLGVRYHTPGRMIWNAQMLSFFMNGYMIDSSVLGMTEESVGDGTYWMTMVLRLPYYAAKEYLTDTLTVACVRYYQASETHKDVDDDGNLVDQTQPAFEAVSFVFRYDRKTGKVTLPKDEQERDAWFTLPKPVGENPMNRIASSTKTIRVRDVSDEQNGTTVSIRYLQFTGDGKLRIVFKADHLACEVLASETFPEVTLNGTPIARYREKNMWGTTYDYTMSDAQIRDFLNTYSMKRERWVYDEWEFVPQMRFDMFDGPITVEIKDWALYDLNEKGERTLVGTFSFTFTVNPADFYDSTIHEKYDQ